MVFGGLLSAVDVVVFRPGVVGFFLVVRAFVLQVVVMAVGGVLGLRGLVLDGV